MRKRMPGGEVEPAMVINEIVMECPEGSETVNRKVKKREVAAEKAIRIKRISKPIELWAAICAENN